MTPKSKELITTVRVLTLKQAKAAGYKPVTGYFGMSEAEQTELKRVLQELGGVHVVLAKNPRNEFEHAVWRKSIKSPSSRVQRLERKLGRGIAPRVRSK